MFAFQDTLGPVEIAFTDRHGGTSGGPFDVPEPRRAAADATDRGRRRAIGTPQRRPRGPGVRRLSSPGRRPRPSYACGRCTAPRCTSSTAGGRAAAPGDALVTAEPGTVLMVRVADCVPVLLADAGRGVVAAVHAGRPGLAAGVVPAAVAAMRALGADRVTAWVGPHVCGACYEVPDRLRGRGRRASCPSLRRDLLGHARARHRGRGARPAARAGVRRRRRRRAAPSRTRTSTPTAATAPRSGRLAGLVRVRP